PHLAAALELEVLDRVGHVQPLAVDAELRERAVEQAARGADERAPGEVLGVARLLADHEDAGPRRTLAEDGLRRGLPQRAALASGGGIAQRGEAVVDRFRRGALGHGAPGAWRPARGHRA